jgi:hypothetical protein
MVKAFLSLVSAGLFVQNACASQNITCTFSEIGNTDQVIIVLTNDQTGTLSYSSASGDSSTTTEDAKLKIHRISDVDPKLVSFSTEAKGMQMILQMPNDMLLKPKAHFEVILTTRIDTVTNGDVQNLACDSI